MQFVSVHFSLSKSLDLLMLGRGKIHAWVDEVGLSCNHTKHFKAKKEKEIFEFYFYRLLFYPVPSVGKELRNERQKLKQVVKSVKDYRKFDWGNTVH